MGVCQFQEDRHRKPEEGSFTMTNDGIAAAVGLAIFDIDGTVTESDTRR
jgi:hypothetical protein